MGALCRAPLACAHKARLAPLGHRAIPSPPPARVTRAARHGRAAAAIALGEIGAGDAHAPRTPELDAISAEIGAISAPHGASEARDRHSIAECRARFASKGLGYGPRAEALCGRLGGVVGHGPWSEAPGGDDGLGCNGLGCPSAPSEETYGASAATDRFTTPCFQICVRVRRFGAAVRQTAVDEPCALRPSGSRTNGLGRTEAAAAVQRRGAARHWWVRRYYRYYRRGPRCPVPLTSSAAHRLVSERRRRWRRGWRCGRAVA